MTDETDHCLLMREWQGCPDAALATADVCGRFSRTTNRSALAALQALLDYGALEREGGGLRPTARGRELLACMSDALLYPSVNGPDAAPRPQSFGSATRPPVLD